MTAPAVAGGGVPARPAGAAPAAIRCRPIAEAELDAVADLLARGFRERSVAYWREGLARMAARPVPEGCPRFGYVMVAGDRMVGVLLTIFAPSRDPEGAGAWCNLSSWYVEPAFRPYATLLDRSAMGRAGTTYTNISAAPHTVPAHEARGFRRIGAGQVLAAPVLARAARGAAVRAVRTDADVAGLPEDEARMLRDHAAFGCIALVGRDADGCEPFVFARHPIQKLKRKFGFSPVHYGQLVYARSPEALSRFAAGIGRHLLVRHGLPFVAVDAAGPVPGLSGRFFAGWGLRLKRGRDLVPPGDLAYSEMVVFGP